MEVLVLLLPALVVGYWVGHYRRNGGSFQNGGEKIVTEVLQSNFSDSECHLFNHVTLDTPDGTTQIDHILVSRAGVFLIETKDYSGWIFANPNDAKWTQVLFRHKFRFQNPIRQNYRHVLAVRALLDFLPPEAVQSAVVFAGDAEFKTAMPRGVFTVSGLVDYVGSSPMDVTSLNRVQFCVGRLEMARLSISGQTDVEHVESLRSRLGRRGWQFRRF
jgi:hypothetical protein